MCKLGWFTHLYQPLAKLPLFDYSNVDYEYPQNIVGFSNIRNNPLMVR